MSAWASNIHDWENLENFQQNAEAIRERRTANVETLERDVIIPMMTYREQFSEIKRRLDKCESKRIEFDRNSYKLHQLETANINGGNNSKEAVEAARMKVDKSHDAYNAIANDLSNADSLQISTDSLRNSIDSLLPSGDCLLTPSDSLQTSTDSLLTLC